jgi:cyclic patellamide precursor peptide PatG
LTIEIDGGFDEEKGGGATMEQQAANPTGLAGSTPAHAAGSAPGAETALAPQEQGGMPVAPCPTCANHNQAGATASFVYALGRIEPRFPRLAVDKEFAQATGRAETAGLTDRQALHAVLSQRQNRYLVRQLCWVFSVERLDTYILQPRDPADLDALVEALRPTPSPLDVDVVIGVRGPIAPPDLCNGLMVPIVAFDQLYSFDREALVKAIPKPEKMAAKQFETAAADVFERILQVADNAGATDEHRALNYCAVRYQAIYATAADAHARDCALSAVEVRPSRLSGVRKVVDVIFSYTHRQTDVAEKHFCRVDVTEEFPFLVTKLSPYYDR